MRILLMTLFMTLAWTVTSARAQEDHSQHQAAPAAPAAKPANAPASTDPHAGHGGENAAATDNGPWSYKGRKNPEPYTQNRWEMVPAEGNSATYIAADKLSKAQRCAALKRQTVQALDRATRKECGIALDARARESQGKEPAMAGMNHSAMSMPADKAAGGGTVAQVGAGAGTKPEVDHGKMDMTGDGHWMAPPAAAQRANPVKATSASIARGKKIYAANCASCHGANGAGDGPAGKALNPKPADLAAMAPHHPPGDLAWKIENGRGAMPPWKDTLKPTQIWDVVNYLQSLAAPKPTGAKTSGGHAHHGHAH